MATDLGITPEQTLIPATRISEAKKARNLEHGFTTPSDQQQHPFFFIYDFVHLFKSIRNRFCDSYVQLPCGSWVCVDDFYELIDKVRADTSDHTSGFHLSEDHLEVESQDRQDVTMAMQLLSERTSAALKTYFPNDKAKLALAKFVLCCANAFKVATSRIKWDKKDHLHSGFGIYFEVVFHLPNFC